MVHSINWWRTCIAMTSAQKRFSFGFGLGIWFYVVSHDVLRRPLSSCRNDCIECLITKNLIKMFWILLGQSWRLVRTIWDSLSQQGQLSYEWYSFTLLNTIVFNHLKTKLFVFQSRWWIIYVIFLRLACRHVNGYWSSATRAINFWITDLRNYSELLLSTIRIPN